MPFGIVVYGFVAQPRKQLETAVYPILYCCSSTDRYGMRYVAMSLRVALVEKFPEVPEAEILKVSVVSCVY